MMRSIDTLYVFEKTSVLSAAPYQCPEGPRLDQRRCPRQRNAPLCTWQNTKATCGSRTRSFGGAETSNEAAHGEPCTSWRWSRFRSKCPSRTGCAKACGVEMAGSYARSTAETGRYMENCGGCLFATMLKTGRT